MLHPDCEEVLRRVAQWDQSEGVEAARAGEARRVRELAGTPQEIYEARHVTIPVSAREIPATVYRPSSEAAPGVLVWLHGGGFIAGSPDGAEVQARGLANASGCVVLSVDYRLAPEHPFPAGVEDAYAAVTWAAAHAEALGADGGRVAVGGDSAGGTLAAAVTLMARDRGGPRIDFQLLVYTPFSRDVETASRARFAEGYWLTAEGMGWFWDQYLSRPQDAHDPYAAPLEAESLAGLPPALIVLAECDVLADEGRLYGERLEHAGVPVTVVAYAGMLHGFIACAEVVGRAWEALDEIGQALGRSLRG